MAGLKAIVGDLDNVTDSMREYYKQNDEGVFVLAVDPAQGWALENVTGLKETLAGTKEKLRKAREKLEAFGEIDPVEAKDAVGKVDEMASWTPEDKVKQQIEARERQLTTKHQKEMKAEAERVLKLRAALEKNLVHTAAQQAIAKHKGIPELLLPVVEQSVKMIEDPESGDYRAQVVRPDGTPVISLRSGSTDPMSIDEFVDTLKGDANYGVAFEGVDASGSGASGGIVTGIGAGARGKGKIRSGDQETINRSIEDIASGKTVVTDF